MAAILHLCGDHVGTVGLVFRHAVTRQQMGVFATLKRQR